MTALGAGLGISIGSDAKAFGPISTPRALPIKQITTLVPRTEPALERRRTWELRYTRRLRLTDTLIVSAVPLVAAVLDPAVSLTRNLFAVEAITVLVWTAMLWLGRTRARDIMGDGSAEYKRVAHSTGFAFGILAMLFLLFQWQGLRLQVLVGLPVGLGALVASRWIWRKWLMRQRGFGHYQSHAIITGRRHEIEYVLRTLSRSGKRAFTVAGVAPTDGDGSPLVVDGISYAVVGSMDSVAMHARSLEADSIIVASRPDDEPDYLQQLSWELEGTAAELIISSRLTDVAGPRLSLRPVDGLPLIHVQIPRFEGGKHSMKRVMDIVLATVALIPIGILAPFIALGIKATDGGPVFFRQTRIGRDGREFKMIKFRTMCVDAEARLAALKEQNEGNGVLFKLKNDPRITRIGGVLRKFSLDELPQFWNVLRGDMSIVGPRPPLPREVSEYEKKVYRRLFIKPGITGPWQVGGRSDLSWEESVRLDLRYVENWSVTEDLSIMWRTAKVMVAPSGAGAY